MKKYLALGLAAMLAIGATIVPDTYDKLFLRCNGTTTTFVDSSTANPKTITANGNATQLPIKFNKSAGFFNGTSDYVVVPDSADFTFGASNFTIEFFINLATVPAGTAMFVSHRSAGNVGWDVEYISGTGLRFVCTTDGTSGLTADNAWTPVKNTWYHIAAKRDGNTLTTYIEAVPQANTLNMTGVTIYNSTANVLISGQDAGATNPFHGWMKELRISKVARTVAVPTAQYQTDSDTVLLMHFDTPATSPLAPAIAFDGTGDYLSLADSADWEVGASFSAEAFVKFDVVGNCGLVEQYGAGGNRAWFLNFNSNRFYFGVSYDGTNSTNGYFSITPTANRWYHIVGVKNGNSIDVYVNGVKGDSTGDFTGKTPITSSDILKIGLDGADYFNGSMREIRISNVARYTSAFTPSQNGFTVDANTKLYIKGDGDNGNQIISDHSVPIPENIGPSIPVEWITSNGANVGYGVEKIFNGLTTDFWEYTHTAPNYVQVDLGTQKTLKAYSFYIPSNSSDYIGRMPKTWTFDGSNNGSDWTTLDTKTGVVFSGCGVFHYNFTNSTAYRYYKLNITAQANATIIRIVGMGLHEAAVGKSVSVIADTKIKYTEDYRSCIFKDETGKFPYPVGSAKVDFFAIGSGVGYFDGSGDYLSIPDSNDFDVGAGNFTIEGFFRANVFNGATLLDWHDAGVYEGYAIYTSSSKFNADVSTNGSSWNHRITGPSTGLAFTWYHVAFVRNATDLALYVNGTLVDNESIGTETIVDAATTLKIGSGAGDLNGLLDNIRISKGVARYTTTFNPPDDYSAPRIGKRKTNWFFFF